MPLVLPGVGQLPPAPGVVGPLQPWVFVEPDPYPLVPVPVFVLGRPLVPEPGVPVGVHADEPGPPL